jgi:hypothetical protein
MARLKSRPRREPRATSVQPRAVRPTTRPGGERPDEGRGLSPADRIRNAIRGYADRGVFRAFSEQRSRGRRIFRFTWLTREPMTMTADDAACTLTFDELLPDVARASPLLAEVQELVGSRSSRALLAHRRIDPRRVRAECSYRHGAVSVVLHVTGRHQAYAVQRGVNLVSEIFTLLQASHPDYLRDTFGLPAE